MSDALFAGTITLMVVVVAIVGGVLIKINNDHDHVKRMAKIETCRTVEDDALRVLCLSRVG